MTSIRYPIPPQLAAAVRAETIVKELQSTTSNNDQQLPTVSNDKRLFVNSIVTVPSLCIQFSLCVLFIVSYCILSFLCRSSAFFCPSICRVCLWISEERGDRSYKPNQKAAKQQPLPRTLRKPRATRRDYQEVQSISSCEESVETVVPSESGFEGSVKQESVERVLQFTSEPNVALWSPDTFSRATTQISEQFTRIVEANSDSAMSRENEKSSMERIMEMVIQMQTQQNEQALKREPEREKREEDRRRDDLRREERLIETLRKAQSAVPQAVTIVNHKLLEMKEGEEIDSFVAMFEAALRAKSQQHTTKPVNS